MEFISGLPLDYSLQLMKQTRITRCKSINKLRILRGSLISSISWTTLKKVLIQLI
jgi:hypothetical protein